MAQHPIPDKLFFKIGEAGRIVGVPAYVLRFWEEQFPFLRPDRTERGQRRYRKKDIELLLAIKNLLHEKKFTIEGARKHLRGRSRTPSEEPAKDRLVEEIRDELIRIRDLLDS